MATGCMEMEKWIDSQTKLLQKAGLPVKPPQEMTIDQYMDIMAIDKKVDRGDIKFVLLKDLGKAIITAEYDPELLKQTLQHS